MKVSIYLHQYIVDILGQYGTLQDVVNKILDEASAGKFTFEDKPACASREGASRFDIDITNKEYLELISTYPVNSPRISLRRLVYWFVDNEMMYDLGWQATSKYVSKQEGRRTKRYDMTMDALTKLQLCLRNSYNLPLIDKLQSIVEQLSELKEEVKHG